MASAMQERILNASPDWTRIGQIAARVGIEPPLARRLVRQLVAEGLLEQMGSSPCTMQPRPVFRRKA